jgi:hypothetical protein
VNWGRFEAAARPIIEQTLIGKVPRIIMNRAGTGEYLHRYYLHGKPSEEGGSDFTVCLHRFVASDDDGAPHNHPWEQAVSLILTGGYSERRTREGIGGDTSSRLYLPGDVNLIGANDFHRVDLLLKDCWTLFVAGKKTERSWGFLTETGFQPWREFIARACGVDPATINDNVRRSEDLHG